MKLNQTHETLLGALACALNGKEYVPPKDIDWKALFEESKVQAVAPMVFSCVAQYCTDQAVLDEWKTFTMRSLQKNRTIQMQHGKIHQLLSANQIPYAIIKGCASARDYPDALLRAMGDVDFLVPEEYWEQAKALFLKEGFLTTDEDHDFHLAFYKKNFFMEMHHEPFGLTGEEAKRLIPLVPELVEKSRQVECDGICFRMPDAFGHGIVLLLHAYRHLIDTGIGVRHLCDWAAFISCFGDRDFARVCKERFQDLGIWKLAQIFSATAHVYLGTPYQDWMGEIDAGVCNMLMLDILNGGNFGRGEGDRYTQNKSLYAQDKELTQTNSTIQLLRTLNRIAMERYPRAMKICILRPLGWLIIGVRYIFRVLTGKREMAPSDTMQMVAMRKSLYQQFEVFDKK